MSAFDRYNFIVYNDTVYTTSLYSSLYICLVLNKQQWENT